MEAPVANQRDQWEGIRPVNEWGPGTPRSEMRRVVEGAFNRHGIESTKYEREIFADDVLKDFIAAVNYASPPTDGSARQDGSSHSSQSRKIEALREALEWIWQNTQHTGSRELAAKALAFQSLPDREGEA